MNYAFSRVSMLGATWIMIGVAQAAGTPAPDKFLSSAMQDGRAEIAVCQLALAQASNDDVKAFAQRMIKDHSDTDAKIEAIAQRKKYKLSSGTTLKQKASYEMLKHRSGAGFDKAFMEHNVSDHQDDIKHFTEQAQNSRDGDVKEFASTTLTTLKEHLAMALDVNSKLTAGK